VAPANPAGATELKIIGATGGVPVKAGNIPRANEAAYAERPEANNGSKLPASADTPCNIPSSAVRATAEVVVGGVTKEAYESIILVYSIAN
jgi:hypothetical protein